MAGEAAKIEEVLHTAAETTHASAEGSAGMPQLDFSTFPNQIFWLAVSLVAIYLILNKVALPRIAGILANRAGTISGHIMKAEELKALAAEAQTAYDESLANARAEASQISKVAQDQINTELAAATAKADAEIAARGVESEKAIADIRASAVDSVAVVARDTAEALIAALGGKADAKAIADAVATRMKG
ncbi:MAG: F0F1 ATP synthase subunit B' [Deltaproteobacteria bacterium]